jgi:RimJ/RimL family protein N-acetyltransferase
VIDGSTALASPRLDLEPLRVEHAAEMVAVLGEPSLYSFTGGEPPSLEMLDRRYRAQVDGSGDPNELWLNWIIRHRSTGAAVGFVQATVELDRGPLGDIAWVIGIEHQGQGFAIEAARAMAEWLLTTGVATLTAHIHPDHAASQAVARAAGLVETTEVDDDGEVVWASPAAASR